MNQFENFLSIVELDDDTSTRRCIDVDECQFDPCGSYMNCENTFGSTKTHIASTPSGTLMKSTFLTKNFASL